MYKLPLAIMILAANITTAALAFEPFDHPARRPVPILGAIIWVDAPRTADTQDDADRSSYAVRPANFLQEPLSDEAAASGKALFQPPLSTEGEPSDGAVPATIDFHDGAPRNGSPFHGMPLATR